MPVTSDDEPHGQSSVLGLGARQSDDAFTSTDGDAPSEEDELDGDELEDDGLDPSSVPGPDGSPPRPLQNYFAPPFYGRPPTPLPPSPSLTSLLRPSRPTTPDASDDDFEPVPRASPKVPTYEYYGFVLYLFSSLTFLIYLLWSYLPSPFLHALGIYYYPNRWWSLAIPAFLVMTLVYVYVALGAYNVEILTVGLGSLETIVDDCGKVAVVDGRGRLVEGRTRGNRMGRTKGRRHGHGHGYGHGNGHGHGGGGGYVTPLAVGGRDTNGGGHGHGYGGSKEKLDWGMVWNEGTDAVMDVPLAGVCEVLYGEGRNDHREEDAAL